MSVAGPTSPKLSVVTDNLNIEQTSVFKILQELAIFADKNKREYITALAQNLMYELRGDAASDEATQFEALAGYLTRLRFDLVGGNVTLALRNPEYFTRILVQTIFTDSCFVIDTTDDKEKENLRKLILDIQSASADKRASLVADLKKLFEISFSHPRLIATLLPFYDAFLRLPKTSPTEPDLDAKKKSFIGQISFSFVESALVNAIRKPDPEELKTLGNILRTLRKEGLLDSLIVNLDLALINYKPVSISAETLLSVEQLYSAYQEHLNVEKQILLEINQWTDYANTFEILSPLRKLILQLVSDIKEESTYLLKKMTEQTHRSDEALIRISSTRKAITDMITPFNALKTRFEPFRERALQLAKVFKQLGQNFPEKSQEHKNYNQLIIDTLTILTDLERNISLQDLRIVQNYLPLIEAAQAQLTDLIREEINFEIAGLTPMQRIADQLGKVKDPDQRKKLEISLLRLQAEGADIAAKTNKYRARAATTALGDVPSNLFSLKNPLLPRSRSAGEIAAMHGASPAVLEKLSPRAQLEPSDLKAKEHKKPQSGAAWIRTSPKEVFDTVKYYIGWNRVAHLIESAIGSAQSIMGRAPKIQPKLPVDDLEENAKRSQLLVDHGYTALTPFAKAAREKADAARRQSAAAAPAPLRTGVDTPEKLERDTPPAQRATVY